MAEKTLGDISDELHFEREEIRKLGELLERKKKSFKEKEKRALDRMKEAGVLSITGAHATMSVSEVTVPSIEDWKKYYRYIKQHNAFHLLERRPASKAWREEVENRRGKPVPGSKGFEKRTLNLRNT